VARYPSGRGTLPGCGVWLLPQCRVGDGPASDGDRTGDLAPVVHAGKACGCRDARGGEVDSPLAGPGRDFRPTPGCCWARPQLSDRYRVIAIATGPLPTLIALRCGRGLGRPRGLMVIAGLASVLSHHTVPAGLWHGLVSVWSARDARAAFWILVWPGIWRRMRNAFMGMGRWPLPLDGSWQLAWGDKGGVRCPEPSGQSIH
jgi:hypothetical protein